MEKKNNTLWVFLQKNKMSLGFLKPNDAKYYILIYFQFLIVLPPKGFTDIKTIELVSQKLYWPKGICILLYNLYYINMKILYISLCTSFVKLSLGLYIHIYSFSYTIYLVLNTFKPISVLKMHFKFFTFTIYFYASTANAT